MRGGFFYDILWWWMGTQVYLFLFPVAAALGVAYLGMFAGAYWQHRQGVVLLPPMWLNTARSSSAISPTATSCR